MHCLGSMHRLQLRLDHARDLSPSVRHLVFCVEGPPADYRSGQCLNLHVPVGDALFPRLYSITCSPRVHAGRRLELAVTRVPEGLVSHALHTLKPGARLEAGGPCGGLVREEIDQPTLLIATGSGLGPLRAMLQDELARDDGPPIGLLFGCRTEQDLLWADELDAWAEHHPRFRRLVTLSRGSDAWRGRRGHVQAHLAEALGLVQPTRVFICGLSAMTSSVEELLRTAGFPKSGILLEEYDT